MRSLPRLLRFLALALPLAASTIPSGRAWDYEGHRLVHEVALDLLPTNTPAFLHTPEARERIGFLGGELDRWRNTPHYPLRHANHPDHYLDLEDLEPLGLTVTNLPAFRYDFVAHLARVRAEHPDRFPPLPANDTEHTKALPGFLPWTIAEGFARVKSAFSYLKAYEELGTPAEVAQAQANVILLMGLLGHAVGDSTQPLHTTRNYNGWIDRNPEGFATNRSFHSWIDGGYLRRVGVTTPDVRPHARPPKVFGSIPSGSETDPAFRYACALIRDQFPKVETLYRMEKAGHFSATPPDGLRGRDFLVDQLAIAASALADLWLTAWEQAPSDVFLRGQLAARKAAAK